MTNSETVQPLFDTATRATKAACVLRGTRLGAAAFSGVVMCLIVETYTPTFFGVDIPRGIYASALAEYQRALRP